MRTAGVLSRAMDFVHTARLEKYANVGVEWAPIKSDLNGRTW